MTKTLYKTPFSRAYWRDAAADFHSLHSLIFAALMIAACMALGRIPSFQIMPGVKLVSWGYLARSLCGLVCGPVTGIVFGVAEDTLGFFLFPTGEPYFPGYALNTALGVLIYALFLYRAQVTVLRVFLAKLCNNVLVNIILSSLWASMWTDGGFLFIAGTKVVTNLIRLPFEVLILTVLYAAMLPILHRTGFLPDQAAKLRAWIDRLKKLAAKIKRKSSTETSEPWEE